jgi:hypothetical protein
MMQENEVPLIHTRKGNLPISELQYEVRWEETQQYVKMIETYYLAGEPVLDSTHVYFKRGDSTEASAQSLN